MEEAAGKMLVVIDGEEERKYEVVANLTFSPDSKRYVYWADKGKEWIIVVNGVEVEKYDRLASPIQSEALTRGQAFLAGRLISYPASKFVFDTPLIFHTLVEKNGKIVRVKIELNAD
jgi:hypothetical protein